MTCPLLYRFRVVDRLPERPSVAATRGTVVHAVLERLFDAPAPERTVERARSLLAPEWERLLAEDPELAALLPDAEAAPAPGDGDKAPVEDWLRGAGELLERYFALEDPQRLEPAQREVFVEVALESGLVLRGYIDRVDVAPDGAVRVVDYKTGRAPGVGFEARAMFQMRFYALVLWRLHGTVPRMLQLLYLGSGEVLRYEPDEADLRATERKVVALWQAISRAARTGDWRPNPEPALRLVRPPGAVPRVRRHASAAAWHRERGARRRWRRSRPPRRTRPICDGIRGRTSIRRWRDVRSSSRMTAASTGVTTGARAEGRLP
jgi:putative RecB family exonuclease